VPGDGTGTKPTPLNQAPVEIGADRPKPAFMRSRLPTGRKFPRRLDTGDPGLVRGTGASNWRGVTRLARVLSGAALLTAFIGCAAAVSEPPLPGPPPAAETSTIDAATSGAMARLAQFRAQRRSWTRLPPRPSGPWPLPVLATWRTLLDDLEPVWTGAPGDEAVRTYVVVEAELDQTRQRFGPPPPWLARAIHQTRRRLAAARGWVSPRRAEPICVEWPVAPVIVTSGYGPRRDPVHGRRRFHHGIDLGGSRGDVVFTAAPGTVIAAGWFRGYGRRVVVRHGPDLETWYGHLDRVLVVPGDEVGIGDPVGLMGASGRTTGPHLHFEVREQDEPVDPHAWLGRPLSEGQSVQLTRR